MEIPRNQWLDVVVSVDPELWDTVSYINLYLQSHVHVPDTTEKLSGPFNAQNHYLIRFNLKANGVWIQERTMVESWSEYTGRKGSFVDATPGMFAVDSIKGTLRLRYKFLENAYIGLWYLYSMYTPGFIRDLNRIFIVTEKMEKPVANKLTLVTGFVLILIIIIVVFRHKRQEYRLQEESKKHPEVVKKVDKYIDQNLSKSLTVKQIADTFFISERNLSRIYRNACSKSIKSVIFEKRMGLAKKLLTETDESISEILYKAGFNDPSYFSHKFKGHTGLTPLEFRKKLMAIIL
jgi:AraC-like DNA-binding protein